MGFNVLDTLAKLATESGFAGFFAEGGWQNLVMIVVACVLLYLGIVKGFEPLLLVGIAFGCLLANVSYFPGLDAVNPDLNATNALYHPELWEAFLDKNNEFYHSYGHILSNAGLLDIFYIGVKAGLYPSLIFMGVGAMTDFGPLIADPKSLLLGAAAQLGVFVAFFGAICLGFTGPQAASIGIIGGADGPTAIFLTNKLAPELLGAIAIAAYSYMALIPLIQPPIMKLLTTEKDRQIKMTQARPVSKNEKILFRYRAECADEHHHHFPVHLRRRNDGRLELPEARDTEDHPARSGRVCDLHRRRPHRRQHHVQGFQGQGQPADRLRGRLRGPDGRACFADGRPEGQSRKLPSDARHGPERGRRHRLRHRSRLPACRVWLISVFKDRAALQHGLKLSKTSLPVL